jgi:general secretion pathway protein I
MKSGACRGFTLLEVLVALAIVAVGLTAALRATGVGTEAAGEYRDHMLALWLAQNIVVERVARREWPTPGVSSREEEFGSRRFLVRQEVKPTPNPRFRRLDVSVANRDEPGRALQRSVVFLTPPE